MTLKLKIDPVTRIEGHLAIYLEIEDNIIRGAEVRGEMFRGFEGILTGRDPLDAPQITQRICGVCPISHGLASIFAQEKAYSINPPDNARLMRNLIQGSNLIQSHIMHFYLLSGPDYFDMAAASEYQGNDLELMNLKHWIKAQSDTGNLYPGAPFLPKSTGNYVTHPELNFNFIKHYFEALKIRALCNQMGALFAGKMPHAPSIVVGGVTELVTAINIARYKAMLSKVRTFIDRVYLPDIIELALSFPDYYHIGKGCGNLLSYGGYQESSDKSHTLLLGGTMIKGLYEKVSPAKIREEVKYSKYSSLSKQHPLNARTIPDPKKNHAYSWLKAPRYEGFPLETGPLASIMLSYRQAVDSPVGKILSSMLSRLNQDDQAMYSVLGRHIARGAQCKIIADRCAGWIEELVPGQKTCVDFSIPASGEGMGLTEAPRGALGHWIRIEKHLIANYQCVIPTTWNCSPKDDQNVPGPLEQSLIGTRLDDSRHPIEAMRIVRSYDPCIACAVH